MTRAISIFGLRGIPLTWPWRLRANWQGGQIGRAWNSGGRGLRAGVGARPTKSYTKGCMRSNMQGWTKSYTRTYMQGCIQSCTRSYMQC